MKYLMLALTITVSASVAQARDAPVGLGEGIISCGTWITDRKNPALATTDNAWLLGFISAFNLYMLSIDEDVARGTDKRGLIAWINNYCSVHPLDSLESASASLILELQRRSGAR
jgi:hypothetical protein